MIRLLLRTGWPGAVLILLFLVVVSSRWWR
ncbi:hypothetical protein SAMN05444365_11327 [Micromonospora pattaloongensis]|uniref:Uncharacterized protein n=1 Tax=Micromonospora pattaloongensis TaxID=405436 RepID=A0A1H3SQB3_9ACTN|nr:hypothetical protein SAMN05444365_11327 [Micromonospora pattaloongensis]